MIEMCPLFLLVSKTDHISKKDDIWAIPVPFSVDLGNNWQNHEPQCAEVSSVIIMHWADFESGRTTENKGMKQEWDSKVK